MTTMMLTHLTEQVCPKCAAKLQEAENRNDCETATFACGRRIEWSEGKVRVVWICPTDPVEMKKAVARKTKLEQLKKYAEELFEKDEELLDRSYGSVLGQIESKIREWDNKSRGSRW